jgi:UDP-N-acetylmuramyl pentapeptide phosphotransferase/UDP-N-acetylglucosamine-1-phosphate transferase
MLQNLIYIIIFQIFITLPIIKISRTKGLLDIPNERKIHIDATPYTGGIILALTYLFIIFISDFENKYLNLILSYGFIISLTGLIDDRYYVRPGTKLLLQTIPIFFLIDQNLYLTNLGNYIIFGNIELGSVERIFTFLCCLLLINAFNYNDGIDGLAAVIAITVLISFSFFLSILENKSDSNNLIIILTPIFIFLIFNFGLLSNFKVFLGDSGSNLLGFIIAFIAIYIFNENGVHPAIIIWPLAYVVYEFLSVTIFRIIKNTGTFKPGKDHLHYEIIDLFKLNHFYSVLIILSLNIFLILIGSYIFFEFGQDISIIIFIFFFIIYLLGKFIIRKYLA